MPRIITSPVKRWPGTVTLADPLTFPQFKAFREAVERANAYIESSNGTFQNDELDALRLAGVMVCVAEWNLENFTPDPFPATPRKAANRLIHWLTMEIIKLCDEEDELPNA